MLCSFVMVPSFTTFPDWIKNSRKKSVGIDYLVMEFFLSRFFLRKLDQVIGKGGELGEEYRVEPFFHRK